MQDTFTKSLEDMLRACMAHRQSNKLLHHLKTLSMWCYYTGPDCAPFRAYLRFGQDAIIIATIIGQGLKEDERVVRKGRMPIILKAAFEVADTVVIESVINSNLVTFLQNNDFVQDPHVPGNYTKTAVRE